MPTYIIEDGEKRLQLDDNSKVNVVAPLSLQEGQNVKLIPSQETRLSNIETDVDNLWSVAGTKFGRLETAADLVLSFAYLNAGTSDQRIQSITYSSASLSLTGTETYAYAGTSGNYRLTSITRT